MTRARPACVQTGYLRRRPLHRPDRGGARHRAPASRPRRSRCTRPTCTGVETLIFSTHGESMGRGAHPGEMRRACTTCSPTRLAGASSATSFPIKHETSFQGGDGYLFFANRRSDDARAGNRHHGRRGSRPRARIRSTTDTDLRLDFHLPPARLPAAPVRASRLSGAARRLRGRTSCSRPARVP